MTRRKSPPTSAAIEAQIQRLEEERRRAEILEDQRRGELLRGYLVGPFGHEIRGALRSVVSPRDAYLFGVPVGKTSDGIAKESANTEAQARASE